MQTFSRLSGPVRIDFLYDQETGAIVDTTS